ncbi:hypothetical protein C0992_002776 [Termitomyces sp. T32_za158]|nr:hypothetical protein C0992_002776 [Termitomyces sp. T32_za158]
MDNRMYPDHIKPLDGLYGFAVSSSNNYQGTLFRLALQRHVRDSSLGDAWDIRRLREDLIKPFEDRAQEFLLFTSIRKIKIYHRTSRETVCTRTISSELTEEMTVAEFKTKVFDVIKCSQGQMAKTKTQHWHVVSTLTSCDLEVSQSLIKYRLRSPITLEIAARTDIKHDAKKERRPVFKFFSSLPLKSSHLPVHISAPFILSDDRRQVRLDNLDPAAANYNRWLLSTAVPPLYMFLLSDLLEHSHDNISWWPGSAREEDELSQLVTSSFYKNLKTSQQRVFLPSYKDEPTPLISADIVLFSTLNDNDPLNQVFRLLKPPLVLLSPQLVGRAHDAGLTKLTPAYLSDLIRRSSINTAAHLQFKELNRLLEFLGQDADNLLGLHLLPGTGK